jgi:hypothetical protein
LNSGKILIPAENTADLDGIMILDILFLLESRDPGHGNGSNQKTSPAESMELDTSCTDASFSPMQVHVRQMSAKFAP